METTPAESLSLWDYFVKCIKNCLDFKGRARRKEYWGFVLFAFITSLVLGFTIGLIMVADKAVGNTISTIETVGDIVGNLYAIALILPSWAVGIRRLHDIGKSGWNILWCFTIIGIIPVLIWACRDSQEGENKYGPNPKA